ncbi:MAG: L-fucose/L-arabinose isomerase family protein [Alicyclobacillaceae bacterium]|nr:L-fucose/L-arabinose isomerase family protein [Alicyclobacillaceae bacterium]
MTRSPVKPTSRARVGLYSIGLRTYWNQFDGLRERLVRYGCFIEQEMGSAADVYNFGLVDSPEKAREAGEWFNAQDVDIVFCHSATYATSSIVLPIHQICPKPVVVLNLQPTPQVNYRQTTTGEWLAHCGACPVPEISYAFHRANIPFRVVNGLLGMDDTPGISLTNEVTRRRPEAQSAWLQIRDWIKAASVVRNFRRGNFGFLGNTYNGMLDMYSDFTLIQAKLGIHVEILEMCDLNELLRTVTEEEVRLKLEETQELFEISEEVPADPIAKKPSAEQLRWSAKIAVAQEKLVVSRNLDALAYYYHGTTGSDYEALQAGFILGHSLLTARGIPCAGEGDLKTAIAMKICDILGAGGSFSEIVVVDYENQTILLGHDGPFHVGIARGKPILRGMSLYHGKQGTGISVEAKIQEGPITTLQITQTRNGDLKLIIGEGEATDGSIMHIGNTQTAVRFREHPDIYMERWFAEGPTHHFAMSIGHNAALFKKVGDLLGCPTVVL